MFMCSTFHFKRYLNHDLTINTKSLDLIFGKNNYDIKNENGTVFLFFNNTKTKLCLCYNHIITIH